MDIKLLRAFVILARQGQYRSAAEVLCLTQPALTKQIQTLEHLIGLTLFKRGRQGARLTNSGQLIFSRACELLKQHDDFREFVSRVEKGNVGKLVLGFGVSAFQLAPVKVTAFRKLFTDIEVSLNDISSDEQYRMLLNGQLQAGFVRLPVPKKLNAEPLLEERLVLAVTNTLQVDPTNIQRVLDTYQLLQISPHRGQGLTAQITNFLRENKLCASTVYAADDIQTLLALVAAGSGVALLPAGVSHILPSDVKLVALEGIHTRWQIGIAWAPEIKDCLRDNFVNMVLKSNILNSDN
ncbi:LysR family transcriptional regulator [Xenorhabdus bharatensis]|uniref:LysR family transcriptional regulator n=1 Tax=Xenorhabdus bharatensis TaxID=3136256 RepID=UPI0030F39025